MGGQPAFATRAAIKQGEFRLLMRRGRLSLVVGLLFLAVGLVLSELVAKLAWQVAGHIISEGLTIAGWVAMWRPLQVYLYDWWPLRDERCNYERLARMRLRVIPTANVVSASEPLAA